MNIIEAIIQSIQNQNQDANKTSEQEHTSSQIQTLVQIIVHLENLTRKPDRGETGDQPTVMVPNPLTEEAITSVILHCTNRINSILNDDSRWKSLPKPQTLSKEERQIKIQAEKLLIEKEKMEIKERKFLLETNKKLADIRIQSEKRKNQENQPKTPEKT